MESGTNCIITSVEQTASPKKRSFDTFADSSTSAHSNTVAGPTSPESTNSPANSKPMLPTGASREPSPALSITSSLTSFDTVPPPFGLDGAAQSTLESSQTGPKPKRRKLTPGEKLEREREKAEKERLRTEQKQIKDEERRQKAEEQEEKKRQKEIEKQKREQEREDEKRRLHEERDKKEKAQSRINSFFAKPATPKPATTARAKTPICAEISADSASPKPQETSSASDYDRMFLPFSLPSNSKCAPISRYTWDGQARQHLQSTFETLVGSMDRNAPSSSSIRECLSPMPWELSRRPSTKHSVKELVKRVLEPTHVDDLPAATNEAPLDPVEELRTLPVKFLFFHEDIRPPFVGTYTKAPTEHAAKRVSRNPFAKVRTDTDYDYDSEAEWEEPEEGEDLNSDIESEADSVDTAEDMAGFLDDEDADGPKKRLMPLDMEPVCTGICWENEYGKFPTADANQLKAFKLVIINDAHKLPIDPFSTAYWVDSVAAQSGVATSVEALGSNQSRTPLQLRLDATNAPLSTMNPESSMSKPKARKVPKGLPRLLSGEDLERFKSYVRGSVHNQIGLLAILKKEVFPKQPQAVLKDTLQTFAVRYGRTEAEKKWMIVGENPPS